MVVEVELVFFGGCVYFQFVGMPNQAMMMVIGIPIRQYYFQAH